MRDIRYLLSITELLEGVSAEQLREEACRRLDTERRRKLEGAKSGRRYAEALGAGLLLQLGLQEYKKGYKKEYKGSQEHADDAQESIRQFTVSQILSKLHAPMEAEYTYGEKGKPYFKEEPVYFSLSHSGDYVFGVFSEREIGADIQYGKPDYSERIVSRFFTEKEQELWQGCSDKEARRRLFYKLWTRKEAYGKLTGDGILAGLQTDVPDDILWEDYEVLEDYWLAICRWAKKE